MSSIEKLKERFYSKPTKSDITLEEVQRLADYYGCITKTGGNHQICIVNMKTGKVVPLPQHGKEINRAYVRELQDLFGDEGGQQK